ncbi:hypothetical protein ACJ4V0_16020 [Phreatobacter sp. HK31-P]
MSSTARSWLPFDLLDESVPSLRATPSAWIRERDPEGGWIIDGFDDGEGQQTVQVGQRIGFGWHEKRGTAIVQVSDDRLVTVLGIRPDANCFISDGDYETVVSGFDECVQNEIDNAMSSDFPLEFEVEGYFWSEAIPHVLEEADGIARFVPVNAADIPPERTATLPLLASAGL